jgi:anti-sigma factor RsiW
VSLWSRLRYTFRCSPLARSRCRWAGWLLHQHLSGQLDAEGTEILRQHLADCRHCGLEAEVYARIVDSLSSHGHAPNGSVRRLEEFAERLMDGAEPPG